MLIFKAIVLYAIFVIINHFIIKRVIPTKILLIYESLLILTLFMLFMSDVALWSKFDYIYFMNKHMNSF